MSGMGLACRSCGSRATAPFLSLGRTPLANALLTEEQLDQPEARYPLNLVFCPQCSLTQITESASAETLFSDYLYFSSFSDTMVRHAQELSARLRGERRLDASSLVVEIASNDGYLLQHYRSAGVPVLGIEPAANVARVAEERGILTRCAFFGEAFAGQLRAEGVRADVVHAHNVLAHVPDLNGFVAGIAHILRDDGVAVIEVPCVCDLIDHVEFDTIYHEHLCYFSLTALVALVARHGLRVVAAERVAIHGGSLRVILAHAGKETGVSANPEGVWAMLEAEDRWGIASFDRYAGFAATVEALRGNLLALLRDLKRQGKRLAAYGASAKGSTLLNYCGVGRETLDFVADRSTVKQGRFTPGSHLPIVAPDELLRARPDYVLLLTWNFAEEILAQQRAYREQGGRFIIPVPAVEVV